MGYKKDVIKGVSWIGLLRFLTKLVGFFETLILARILVPEQFGEYGIALLSLGLLEVITETGVNVVLLQEEDIDRHIDSAWIVSIVRGVVISLLLFVVSPLVAGFFHAPNATNLLYLISVVPLLRGFINPSVVKFQKELRFGRDFQYRTVILFIDTAVSLSATYITRNPIGIITGLLTGVMVELFLSFVIISPRPKMKFEKAYVSKIFHRGKWVTASSIFNYLFENADNIVVGRMLGASSLGVYQLAYSLAVIPLSEVGKVFFHVTAPVLIKILHEYQRVKNAFLKVMLTVLVLVTPVVLILLFFPWIFVLLLGAKWQALVTVIPVLAILGLMRALSGTAATLFISVKKQEYTMITTLVTIGGLVVTIVPLVSYYGLVGAGSAALIGSLLAMPFFIYYIQKIFRELKKRPV